MNQSYVFADAQQAQEWERLSAVQAEFDLATQRRLEKLGVGPGWACLEVGPGAGSIMTWLCDRVGRGRVVAVDLDPRFVANINRPNLEVRQLDIAKTRVEGHFDLVHARFVLMHIPERERALANMVQALKPGGWLLLEEPDFATAVSGSEDPATAEAVTRVLEATRRLYTSMGVDSFLGRRLPDILQRLLQAVDAEADIAVARGSSQRAKIWRMAVEHLRQPLINIGIASETDVGDFIRLADEPTAWMLDYTTVAAWGQRGPEPDQATAAAAN